jgi:hypothetical protein
MPRRWRAWGPLITGIAFLTTLLLHAQLGSWSRFLADDYCSAGMARRLGILRAVWYWYLTWTGRYSASALDATFGLLGPGVTPLVPGAVLIVWVAVLTVAAALLSRIGGIWKSFDTVILAAALLFLTLTLSPNVPQSLYWGQGMRSIVSPLILSTVYLILLLRFSRKEWATRAYWLWLTIGFLLAFFVGGLNETFTTLELSGLVAAVCITGLARRKDPSGRVLHFLLVGFLGAALAFLVVVKAPGNAFRQAFFPPPPDPVHLLNMASANFAAFLAHTFGTPERLVATLGVLGLSIFMGMQVQATPVGLWRLPLVLAGGLAFAFICFVPSAYGLSDAPPDRTLMIPAHLLSAMLIVAGLITGNVLAHHMVGFSWRPLVEAGILLLTAVVSSVAVVTSDQQLLASRKAFVDYAANWDTVNAQIIRARALGQTQILIRPLVNWAQLDEPNDNPKFWVNVCYKEYYGIQVLATDQP